MYDAIIIGSGPAGYTAAIYCIRAGLSTVVLEGFQYGGQLMYTVDIENYPGFPDRISGADLMTNMRQQCKNLGCELIQEDVIGVNFNKEGSNHEVITNDASYITKTVIIATGATAKKLSIPSENIFWNNGISACAVCDGALPIFRRKPLIVVGGGDTACEEALFLSRFGSNIYMLVRGDKMRASHKMRIKVEQNDKIEIIYNTEVIDAIGDKDSKLFTGVLVKNNKNLTTYNILASGLFYAIGHTPNTQFLNGVLETDNAGYLITHNTKTSIPGIFACGDVQDPIYRQAITAAGSGCIAAVQAEKYLTE
jgi:thioredoxin reductase (NADPH)